MRRYEVQHRRRTRVHPGNIGVDLPVVAAMIRQIEGSGSDLAWRVVERQRLLEQARQVLLESLTGRVQVFDRGGNQRQRERRANAVTIVRLDGQGALVAGESLVELAFVEQDRAQIGVILR